MITINVVKDLGRKDANGNPVKYCEGSCLSTDVKPTQWDNGSKLPGLNDRYVVPQVDPTHSISGRPADEAQFGSLMEDCNESSARLTALGV